MSIETITTLLHKKGDLKVAQLLLDTFQKYAFHFEEYDDLAKSAFKIKDYNRAIKFGELALAKAARDNLQMWTARSNLINVYNHANQPEKALRLIKANDAVIPDDKDTQLEKAFSLFLMNQKDEAEAMIRQQLKREDLTEDERTKLMFNLGTYEMRRDNFLYGLELFLIEGKRMELWKKPKFPGEHWMGQEAKDKDLLVVADAGIGDEIVNVRFMKHLKERGINPVWYTERKDVAVLFEQSGFDVITSLRKVPENIMWTHGMTLPLYLELSYEDLWYGSYIRTSKEKTEEYKFIRKPGLNIGLRWQGNPEYDHDLHRSVELNQILSVLPEANLVSLQRDTGLEELQEGILDTTEYTKTFSDTLGIIDNLDVVITTCTSVAHASAASGKRTFVFVPISAYYVWTHNQKQTPWYGDNVTVLYQEKPRDWSKPIAELKEHLRNL